MTRHRQVTAKFRWNLPDNAPAHFYFAQSFIR
jgi:hypothetical protein